MNSPKIKILYLIDELLPGGTENQLILLSEGLPREQFIPIIGVLQKTEYQDSLNLSTPIINFNLNVNGRPFLRNISLLWRLLTYLNREKINIVQTHFIDSSIYGSLAVRLCRNRPYLIGTRRNLYHWVDEEPRAFRFYSYVSRWADKILVNSYQVYDKCKERESIPSHRIVVIQNGVEIEKFSGISSEDAKRKIGLSGVYPVIGVVANWRPVKGLTSFIKAAAQIHAQISSARFILAGFGPQKSELVHLSQELGIEDHVIFMEDCSNIHEIIPAFDIAVQSSLSESFSNVLIEYMAAERPIVATRVGDAENVIEEGKEGLLIKPNCPEELCAAILYLLQNRQKAAEMGMLARTKVEKKWRFSKILDTYHKFYFELIQQKRGTNDRSG